MVLSLSFSFPFLIFFRIKVFQKEQLLTGDFYSQWLKCESETEKVGTTFSDILKSCLVLPPVEAIIICAFNSLILLSCCCLRLHTVVQKLLFTIISDLRKNSDTPSLGLC